MDSKLHRIIKGNYSRRIEGLLLNKYGMRKGSKLEIKHQMVEKKDVSWGAFVKRHERPACQLRDNVWGKSITTCNLADLAAFVGDARSQDERRLFCKRQLHIPGIQGQHVHLQICVSLCHVTILACGKYHWFELEFLTTWYSLVFLPTWSHLALVSTYFHIWNVKGCLNKIVINMQEPYRWLWWLTEGSKAISSVYAVE